MAAVAEHRKPRRRQVGEIVQTGRGPSEVCVGRLPVADHRVQRVYSLVCQRAGRTEEHAVEHGGNNTVARVLRDRFHGGPADLGLREIVRIPPDEVTQPAFALFRAVLRAARRLDVPCGLSEAAHRERGREQGRPDHPPWLAGHDAQDLPRRDEHQRRHERASTMPARRLDPGLSILSALFSNAEITSPINTVGCMASGGSPSTASRSNAAATCPPLCGLIPCVAPLGASHRRRERDGRGAPRPARQPFRGGRRAGRSWPSNDRGPAEWVVAGSPRPPQSAPAAGRSLTFSGEAPRSLRSCRISVRTSFT